MLLTHPKIDVNAVGGVGGEAPLHYAVRFSHVHPMAGIALAGVSMQGWSLDQRTDVAQFCQYCSIEVRQLLLDHLATA